MRTLHWESSTRGSINQTCFFSSPNSPKGLGLFNEVHWGGSTEWFYKSDLSQYWKICPDSPEKFFSQIVQKDEDSSLSSIGRFYKSDLSHSAGQSYKILHGYNGYICNGKILPFWKDLHNLCKHSVDKLGKFDLKFFICSRESFLVLCTI